VQSLEHPEDSLVIRRLDADAVVRDRTQPWSAGLAVMLTCGVTPALPCDIMTSDTARASMFSASLRIRR
jgi:hypothetical protein